MQTFLPYENFGETARCLDRQRLGKQRIECVQLLRALREGGGWARHPACLMWQGSEPVLAFYALCIITEWKRRGYRDQQQEVIKSLQTPASQPRPWWLGNQAFHAAHRSNLLRKAPEYYGQFGWEEPATLPYQWPTPEGTFRCI